MIIRRMDGNSHTKFLHYSITLGVSDMSTDTDTGHK